VIEGEGNFVATFGVQPKPGYKGGKKFEMGWHPNFELQNHP